jgi:lipopolysaccharide/colanic/teichoic acid biosynthesis glycosyltransferase
MCKRLIDMLISAVALLLLSPLLLVIAAWIRLTMGRPVLFRQVRPGLDGKPFEMVKFRTMTEARDASGALLPDGDRITALGRFLRKSSMDELPELWNVLKGEMSLVGPRPLLMEYLPKYTEEQARRHEVRPGITGWAQVKGRQDLPFSKRFELDVWYVDHRSLWLDIRTLFLTVAQVLARKGVRNVQAVFEVDDVGFAAPDRTVGKVRDHEHCR